MYKKRLWQVSIGIAAISLVIIIVGFIKAMNFTHTSLAAPNNPIPQVTTTPSSNEVGINNPNAIHVLILGDSIAKGTGDQKGKGIGGYLSDLFRSITSKETMVENYAVDGYMIDDLYTQINSGKLDNGIKNATVLIMSIGGSDLQEIQYSRDVQRDNAFNEKQNLYISKLKEVIKKIRMLNKDTQIIMIGNYNPANVVNSSDNIRYLYSWIYNTQLVLGNDDKEVLISTYDLFKNNLNNFLARDKVNPNTTGYQTIAYLISKSVENTIK